MTWTTYGSAAYAQLSDVVAKAKTAGPLTPVTVLVPSNLCGIAVRRHLARGVDGRAGVAGLTVLTVDRLAERIASPALVGGGGRPATDAILGAAWRRMLAEDAGVFAPVAAHPATVRALVTAHRDLRDVDDAGLGAIAAGGAVARDLVRLHRQVVQRLRGRFFDVTDLRAEAAAALRVRPDLGREIGAVVLFLPQDLRRGAVALLEALRACVDVRIIAGTTGDSRADAVVVRSLHRIGVVDEPPAVVQPTARTVLHASDADDEVRNVVRGVMTALRTVAAHRIAVLYGAAHPYARLLAEHMHAAGLERNGAGVRPTIERTLARMLLDLLALPDHRWRRDEVLSVLARATVRTPEGRRLPAARWERISREAGVVADGDWEVRLGAFAAQVRSSVHADASEAFQRYREHLATDADRLRTFVAGLRAHLEAGAALTTWHSLAAWGMAAFESVAGDLGQAPYLPEDEARAAEKVGRVLAGLAGLGVLEETADLTALRTTLELELADDLPRHGTFGRGVLVAPLSESIGLDVDVVFVVGLADDLVPGRLDADALLPDEVRALAGGQLAPARERVDRQLRHLLAALASAARSTTSFPRGDLRRSTARLPSRWLLPTLRERSALATVDASGWDRLDGDYLVGSPSYAAGLATATELATEQEWRVRACAAGAGVGTDVATVLAGDPAVSRALELLHARRSPRLTRFDGDLSGHEVPSPAAPGVLMSPTALESYSRCPHGYFMERMLRVRPLESPEEIIFVSPLVTGSIVHESLDEFHRRYPDVTPGEAWSAQQRGELREIAHRVAARFTALGVTGHPLLWEQRMIGILASLDRLLTEDDRVRAETGRRQVRSELPFGMAGEPPVELTLPSGRLVRLRGSADRVDVSPDSIVVVDYKTGGHRAYQGLSAENPTADGTRLQLPVYAKAARAALGVPASAVRAEYWFVDSNTHIAVPLTDEVDQIFTRTVDVIVGTIEAGLFPHRPAADDGFGSYIPCVFCDPDGLGAAEHRQRWQRKRTDPRLDAYRSVVEPEEVAR